MKLFPRLIALIFGLLSAGMANAHSDENCLNGSNFTYPYPVHVHHFQSQNQELEMAYMDVQPSSPNGDVIMLLHGKNFCGATWNETAHVLSVAGYRVIIPDQIGFCKST